MHQIPDADIERLLADRGWLERLARGLVRDPAAAEDLTQDTLVRAMEHGLLRDTSRHAVRGWLASVLRRLAIERHRSDVRRRAREEAVAPFETGDCDALERALLRRDLVDAVLRLDEPERSAITLRFLDDLSYAEIAARQGGTESAVRQRVSRGLARLRRRLDEQPGGRAAWRAAVLPWIPEHQGPSAWPTGTSITQWIAMKTSTKVAATAVVLLLSGAGLSAWLRPPAVEDFTAVSERARTDVLAESPSDFNNIAAAPSERSARSSAIEVVDGPGPWQIGGRVRRGTDGNFSNASLIVRLYSGTNAQGETLTEAHIRADEDGEFSWASTVPAGTVTVVVTPDADGHKVYPDTVTVTEGDPPPDNLQPFAFALDARVHGRVVDPDGEPIAGARVIAHLAEVLTEDDGAYTLPMASDYRSFSILAVAAGHTEGGLALGAVLPGDHHAPDLVLRSDCSVQGRVVDADGAPIPGATVYTYPRERNQTLTDAEGRFQLGGLDPEKDQTRITAVMDGFVSASARVHPGPDDPDPELVLRRGARIAGRVVTESGQPVKNAQVSIGTPYPRADKATYSDESGAFALDVVRPGSHSVWALRPGTAPGQANIKVEVGVEVLDGVEVVMRPGFVVTGIVLDEDEQPIAGVDVEPLPADPNIRYAYMGIGAVTGHDGRFEMNGLTEERVTLHLEAPGCSPLEQVVSAGARVVLRPRRSGSLAGRVVDGGTGEPIRAFTVRLVAPPSTHTGSKFWHISYDWRGSGMSFDDPSGTWTTGAERLAVGCVVGLEVNAPGYAATIVEQVVVTSDSDPHDIRVELNAGATLRGAVSDTTTGLPVPNARLRRFTAGRPSAPRRYIPDDDCETRTDEQGRFELNGVPFGIMFLVVDETDLPVYIDGPFDVSSNTLDRAIALTAGGRVIGRYLDGAGEPLANQRVTLSALETPVNDRPRYTVDTDSDGAFEFENLVAGPHHLRGTVTNPGSSTPIGAGILQLVQVEDSKTHQVDLRPTGHATLTGTIEFEGDLPESISIDLRPKQVPGVWAFRMIRAGVHDGAFTARHLDPGEWRASVFYQDENGQMFTGSAKVQVPDQGRAEVHITVRPRKR